MNRVVWTYRNYQGNSRYHNKVSYDFELMCPQEVEVLKMSLASWRAFAPTYKRVIYLDEGVKKYLESQDLLKWYDEVVLVDFATEIDKPYQDINFFAAPKLWVIGQQSEPFILADTEMTLRVPLSSWFLEDRYYGIRYPRSEEMYFTNWSAESRKKYFQVRGLVTPEHRQFLNPQNMINAGFISWPDPEVAKKVSKDALSICNEICNIEVNFPEKWTLCEESILPSLIEYYGNCKLESIEFDRVDEHCNLVEYSSLGIIPELYEGFKFDLEDLKRRKPEFEAVYVEMFNRP